MRIFSFTLWMLLYPVIEVYPSYFGHKTIDDEGGAIIFLIWVVIGYIIKTDK